MKSYLIIASTFLGALWFSPSHGTDGNQKRWKLGTKPAASKPIPQKTSPGVTIGQQGGASSKKAPVLVAPAKAPVVTDENKAKQNILDMFNAAPKFDSEEPVMDKFFKHIIFSSRGRCQTMIKDLDDLIGLEQEPENGRFHTVKKQMEGMRDQYTLNSWKLYEESKKITDSKKSYKQVIDAYGDMELMVKNCGHQGRAAIYSSDKRLKTYIYPPEPTKPEKSRNPVKRIFQKK